MNPGERPACGPEDGDRGEFGLIRQHFDRGPPRRATRGIGDDCALLAPLPAGRQYAVSTDLLIEDRHFFPGTDPGALGHKSLAVNLSDLAANGAEPIAFTLALSLPARDDVWLGSFARGLFALADRFDCELIGGDTTRGPLTVCITVFGSVPAGGVLSRDAAQPGDDVWVSGRLGAPAWAVDEIRAGRASGVPAEVRERLEWPQPRVALGLSIRHLARAAVDVSDGLVGDLGHIAERSRVGIELHAEAIPVASSPVASDCARALRYALAGGDEYELAFTAATENRDAIAAVGERLALPLARIGRVDASSGVRVVDARGLALADLWRSHDHFG